MYQSACCCKLQKTQLKMAKAISGFVILCKRKFQGQAILWLGNLLEETGSSHFLLCSLQGVVFGLTPLKRKRWLPEIQASHAHMEIPRGRKGQVVSSEEQVIFSRSLERSPLAFHCPEPVYTRHGKEKAHRNRPFSSCGGEVWILSKTGAPPAGA